jgi:cation:H+ antiporter
MFGATIFFILLLTNGAIFFWHGIILILLQISILIRSYILARSSKSSIKQEIIDGSESFEDPKWNKLLKIAGLILLGIFGLPLGAHFLINGAVGLAQFFNVSEEVIGLSIVAVGTSLPELATTFAAVRRNQGEVVLGNIIGSNLFNILFIVGVASLIAPINFQQIDLVQSLGYLFVSVVFLLAIVIKPRIIGRNWGAVFLLSYASYLWFLVY